MTHQIKAFVRDHLLTYQVTTKFLEELLTIKWVLSKANMASQVKVKELLEQMAKETKW